MNGQVPVFLNKVSYIKYNVKFYLIQWQFFASASRKVYTYRQEQGGGSRKRTAERRKAQHHQLKKATI